MLKFVITLITDWLVALTVVSFFVWFALTQPVFLVPELKKPSSAVSQEKLKSHVNKLSQVYAPRTISYNNLEHTAHYIYEQFSAIGDTRYQAYKTQFNRQFKNIVLQMGPHTEEILIIGAHYDAKDNSLDTEGNASGIATLIELARQLAAHQEDLSIQVHFVAYPLSESRSIHKSEMGSFNHAELIQQSSSKVRMMISLDSVGHFSSEAGSQKYPFSFMKYLYPDRGDYISLLGRLQDYSQIRKIKSSFSSASSLPLYSFNTPKNFPKFSSSDHHSYWEKGFPALLITDSAGYRKIPNETNEVAEQLDYEKMAMLVQGLQQVVMDSKSTGRQVQLVQQEFGSSGNLQ